MSSEASTEVAAESVTVESGSIGAKEALNGMAVSRGQAGVTDGGPAQVADGTGETEEGPTGSGDRSPARGRRRRTSASTVYALRGGAVASGGCGPRRPREAGRPGIREHRERPERPVAGRRLAPGWRRSLVRALRCGRRCFDGTPSAFADSQGNSLSDQDPWR
ncbi:hypothetical protein SCA03_48100 [Streptomyces cacaoi]|uniref:Uncharacterized protein n=1 Tax=Streptomyces cacaoi TaxID=1898 RepID=A0A4Y3R4M9_STRCI|nr:hypothetical protein SCA03_48100 [Streptomyces cacaoi]